MKNGKGLIKEYDYEANLEFEGEYLNGQRNGKGKEYENTFLEFEGEYKIGERNGKGKEYYWNNKLNFEGEYLYGKRWNGKGFDEKGNIIYEFNNGKGKIKEYLDERLFIECEYIYGEKNGILKDIMIMEK